MAFCTNWRWLSVYGSWSNSFGANNGVTAAGQALAPETGEQFEAGVKTQLFDDRLLATLAYYHLTKNNIMTADLSTPDPTDNAAIGQARSQGIELDVSGRLSDNFSIIGSYAYTDARITKNNDGYEGTGCPTSPNIPAVYASIRRQRLPGRGGLQHGGGRRAGRQARRQLRLLRQPVPVAGLRAGRRVCRLQMERA
ncbi:TonB-dependent receptor domain-containing protein [Methylomonas koyamae]|uniref:TonB-dependent receptor domain-containing protein n=1 Tax=Methylomonas koyamae TaxID=702114 RepID=UPI003570FF46